jgi:hypothetical protein
MGGGYCAALRARVYSAYADHAGTRGKKMSLMSTEFLQDTMDFLSACLKEGKPDAAVRLEFWQEALKTN